MVLELHVWGPAFGLPSIDAQCIAAVAYLSQAVPREEWILVASGVGAVGPTNELPALRNEHVWIGGFRNIVDYVAQFSGGKWALDAELGEREQADCIAFSSFVEAHGQPLLDLSLYVSSQNYTTVTRPQYSKIQSFPLPYLTPSSIRLAAKARTAHLGLSSLDIDSDPSPSPSSASNPQPNNDAIIPASLRVPRTTVSTLLSQSPESASQIRLAALATSFFEPLQFLRAQKRFFLGPAPTSLDCLALGYLSLALLPDLPSPWLATCMRTHFPQLSAFVQDMQRFFFGGQVSLHNAFPTDLSPPPPITSATSAAAETNADRNSRRVSPTLPWSHDPHPTPLALTRSLASSLADALPVVSSLRHAARVQRDPDAGAETEAERAEVARRAQVRAWETWSVATTVVLGLGAWVGYLGWYGLLGGMLGGGDIAEKGDRISEGGGRGRRRGGKEAEGTKPGLQRYGDAGAALEVLAQQMDMNFEGAVGGAAV